MRSFILSSFIIITYIACSSSGSGPGASYPDISTFNTTPSDQFIVDMAVVADGHMYRGLNANNPHSGAHVHFQNNGGATPLWPSGSAVEDYPAIYAFADGTVSKIDTYYQVTNPQKTHYRYGVTLDFATANGETVKMNYSIEPMIDPGDNTFYTDFIKVNIGDSVSKGDIIAYMYISTDSSIDKDHHIHFNLIMNSGTQAPAIFDANIMTLFTEKISTQNGGVRNFDGNSSTGDWMGDCMGYKVTGSENPFNSNETDCLKI